MKPGKRKQQTSRKPPAVPLSYEPTHDEIAVAAYGLWEAAGKPSGRDEEFWLVAKDKLQQEHYLLSASLLESLRLQRSRGENLEHGPMRSEIPTSANKRSQRRASL
jgi:hypothetical protein